MKLINDKKSKVITLTYIDTILQIIRDLAYIIANVFKGKEQKQKLELIKELEDLKSDIKKAIDAGDEAKLSELLKKRKEIEDKIRIINNSNGTSNL